MLRDSRGEQTIAGMLALIQKRKKERKKKTIVPTAWMDSSSWGGGRKKEKERFPGDTPLPWLPGFRLQSPREGGAVKTELGGCS